MVSSPFLGDRYILCRASFRAHSSNFVKRETPHRPACAALQTLDKPRFFNRSQAVKRRESVSIQCARWRKVRRGFMSRPEIPQDLAHAGFLRYDKSRFASSAGGPDRNPAAAPGVPHGYGTNAVVIPPPILAANRPAILVANGPMMVTASGPVMHATRAHAISPPFFR